MKVISVVVSAIDPSHGHCGQSLIVISVCFLQTIAHIKPVGHLAFAAATFALDNTMQQDHLWTIERG